VDGDLAAVTGVDRFGGDEPGAVLGVILSRPSALLHFGFGFFDGLAHLAAHRVGELVAHRAQLAADPVHQLGPLAPIGATPVAEGLVGEIEGSVDLPSLKTS